MAWSQKGVEFVFVCQTQQEIIFRLCKNQFQFTNSYCDTCYAENLISCSISGHKWIVSNYVFQNKHFQNDPFYKFDSPGSIFNPKDYFKTVNSDLNIYILSLSKTRIQLAEHGLSEILSVYTRYSLDLLYVKANKCKWLLSV